MTRTFRSAPVCGKASSAGQTPRLSLIRGLDSSYRHPRLLYLQGMFWIAAVCISLPFVFEESFSRTQKVALPCISSWSASCGVGGHFPTCVCRTLAPCKRSSERVWDSDAFTRSSAMGLCMVRTHRRIPWEIRWRS